MVIPGDLISEGQVKSRDTIIVNGKTYSTLLAIYDDESGKLTPLEGLWYPRRDDTVIGIIESARLNSYSVDVNSLYKGIIISKYVEDRLSIGDIVESTVRELDDTMTIVLTKPRVLKGGRIIDIRASKIPRLIGKNEAMLTMLTEGTGCMVKAGINGRVWIRGGDISLATEAIRMVQEEAHTSGLTDRVKSMLDKKRKAQAGGR